MNCIRECEVVYRTKTAEPNATIRSSEDVYKLMHSTAAMRAHESLWAVMVDSRRRVVATHEVARGGASCVAVDQGAVFRAAIVIGATALILVHNHPSGDPDPSREDIAFTAATVRVGKLLGIQVLDHVIVAASGFYSMLDGGVLPNPD